MPSKTSSAVVGGAAAAILITLLQVLQTSVHDAFGLLACLSYVTCGMIAVWHYTQEYSITLTGRQGVKLGAYSGVFTAIVVTALNYLLIALGVLPSKEEALDEAMAEVEAAGGAGAEWVAGFIEFMYGVGGLLLGLFLGVVLGLVGGAIGRAIWKKGEDSPPPA